MHGFLNLKAKAAHGVFQWGFVGKAVVMSEGDILRNPWYIRGHFWPFSFRIELSWLNFEWRTKRCVKAQGSFYEKNVKWYGIFSKAGIRAPFYSERSW